MLGCFKRKKKVTIKISCKRLCFKIAFTRIMHKCNTGKNMGAILPSRRELLNVAQNTAPHCEKMLKTHNLTMPHH